MKTLGWIVYWVIYQMMSLVLDIVGLPIVAALALTGSWVTRQSTNPMFRTLADGSPRVVTAWKYEPWTKVWGNDENGVDNTTVPEPRAPSGTRWAAFYWCALRNRTNNLRLLPGASAYVQAPVFRDYKWGYLAVDTDGRWCVSVLGYRIGWLIARDAVKGYREWPVFL